MHFVNIMDSILKQVQGQYIQYFGTNINHLLNLIFQKVDCMPDSRDRSKQKKMLIKILKTWQVIGLFDPTTMNILASNFNLKDWEERMFTAEEIRKINDWKEKFEPHRLPEEVVSSGRFICGSKVSKEDLRKKYFAVAAQ